MSVSAVKSPAGRPSRPPGGGTAQRRKPLMGKNPIGLLLSAPYLVFVFWMSFHDYFFAAPGAQLDRAFVGLDNFREVLSDPAIVRSFGNVGVFLIINVPLTV